jgi:zeta-carotene desaturase
MPSVIVVGGGLAGLAATAALADAGFEVSLYESKPYLGGRATSYPVPGVTGDDEPVDNCQHILLRCCVNLLDFYRRLGVAHLIDFHRQFYFVEPGGRTSRFGAGRLPAPAHFTESFLRMRYLTVREKLAVARGLLSLMREARHRTDLDEITMAQWLEEKRQPPRAVERFWRQVLVSAVNEELDRMAASHAFQVFLLGFLARSDSYEMGVPAVPLGELYRADRWSRWPNVSIQLRTRVEHVAAGSVKTQNGTSEADFCILAVPWNKLADIAGCAEAPALTSSPITGIHLWFDRPVTELPHATLLERNLQWMFNKGGGRHIQLLVSASRGMLKQSRADVVATAVAELGEYFPEVLSATLLKAHVVKEVHATFSAVPGLATLRFEPATADPKVFLAGDWTRSGWPSTMEGAVRSGYIAAEAVARAAGTPLRFLLPDIA